MKILSKNVRLAALLGVVIVFVISSFVGYSIVTNKSARADENPIAEVTKPKQNTTTTEATIPVPQLPQPENSPENEYEKVPVTSIGSIEIPKLGLNTTLYEGVWLTVLNVGPGHWPGTAKAGGYGNMVIAGHRVTHSKPFRHIDDLVDGDEIIVNSAEGRFVYKVTGHDIVYPKDIWIVDQTPGYRITLFACHPPGSAAQRYVIYGDLVNPPTKVPSNV